MSKIILALLAALAILLLCACGAAQPSPTPAQTFQASAAPTSTPAATPSPMPLAEDLVRVAELIPGVCTDAKYASTDNFTGSVIYGSDEIYLRRGTAQKLAQVQSELAQEGLYLCIWDGWRPVAAQFALWRACPDPRYVADPFSGFSNHCRGNTVDLTLVTAGGEPVGQPRLREPRTTAERLHGLHVGPALCAGGRRARTCRNPHRRGTGASGQRRGLCARALRRKLRLPARRLHFRRLSRGGTAGTTFVDNLQITSFLCFKFRLGYVILVFVSLRPRKRGFLT